jgi:transposase
MRKSIGIDVGKKELVYSYRNRNIEGSCSNNKEGRSKLISWIKKQDAEIVVFENTGIYHRDLMDELVESDILFLVANSKKVRDFAKGLGKLAKTDKIDARIISWYGEVSEQGATNLNTQTQRALRDMCTRRAQLMEIRVKDKCRQSEILKSMPKAIKLSISRMLKAVKKELEILDNEILRLINSDEVLQKKADSIESVKGVGSVTAAIIIATLPELGRLNHKEIASLCGVAPFDNSSGQHQGKKKIFGGRAIVRSSLYMATLSATRFNPPIRKMYLRLLERGKLKKVAQIACMRKLIITLNAMLRDSSSWNPEGVPWPMQA